jgi:predicted ribosome quality control (RQC) complex YloA/Tae2 family protein
MDDRSIQEIVNEITPLLIDRAPGKIFQFDPATIAIDFGLRHQGYLFISADPSLPRIHLIQRRVRELERQSVPLNQFGLSLRKELANTRLISLAKEAGDRVVRFDFAGEDELGATKQRTLIAQLTGRSANMFLLDTGQAVIQAARPTDFSGQRIGERYVRPGGKAKQGTKSSDLLDQIHGGASSSPSEAADAYFTSLLAQRTRESSANAARSQLRKKIAQQQKLLKQLQSDLESHANADDHKRIGDLLLANLSTGERKGNRVTLIDYFSDDAAPIEIELDHGVSLQEEAQRRFALYQRSKRAVGQVTSRIDAVKKELQELQAKEESIEQALAEPPPVAGRLSSSTKHPLSDKSAGPKRIPGTRRYISADGFEILVGRTSKDNDHLTLKVAKPNDLWLHAADYGGSHVVVRNSTRKEVPHRTLIEAAQLAAWFSQAKKDPKVDVHYTERKFVSKPKGAKPGLVRLQRFKSIAVEPKEAGTRT